MPKSRVHVRDLVRNVSWLPWLARIALGARGLVYLVVGVFVTFTAITSRAAEGWQGAFLALRDLPGGIAAVFVLVSALLAYIAWRLVEALLDPENLGKDLKGLALRGVRLCSAVVYGALAWKALDVLLREPQASDDSTPRHATALALSEPFGRELVIAAGIGVIMVALFQVWQSLTLDICKHLSPNDEDLSPWIAALGRIGLLARGLVFAIVGGFLVFAAWIYQPQEARAMSGALRVIEQQPYGAWLLGIVGLGLCAFGLFGIAVAFYRRFNFGAGRTTL